MKFTFRFDDSLEERYLKILISFTEDFTVKYNQIKYNYFKNQIIAKQ